MSSFARRLSFAQKCSAVLTFFPSLLQGGFAAQANGWRWPIYELLWISAFALIVLSLLLPETLGSTILLRRAERLRRLTGNPLIKTQTELDAKPNETASSLLKENIVMAFKLCAEPAVLVANSYIGLVCTSFFASSLSCPTLTFCLPRLRFSLPLLLFYTTLQTRSSTFGSRLFPSYSTASTASVSAQGVFPTSASSSREPSP